MGWDARDGLGLGLWTLEEGEWKVCLWQACIEKENVLIVVVSLFPGPVPVGFGFVPRLRAEG